MSALLLANPLGTPGPKGSTKSFCRRCAQRRLPQQITTQEQSEAGKKFRQLAAREFRAQWKGMPMEGPAETRLTFFIPRRMQVKGGVETGEIVPSHQTPYPTDRNSGDVEKHVRTIHDALMDAGVLVDDSLVWKTEARKLWADEQNPAGAVVEVR